MHWEARLRMLADLSVLIDSSADLSPSARPYALSPAQVLNVARGTHMHWDHADGGRGLGESCTIIYRSQSKRPRTLRGSATSLRM